MAKRDRAFAAMEEGSSKRRKAEEAGYGSDVDMEAAEEYDVVDEEEREDETLEKKAMKLWQTVKDAMKDGRPLSLQFLKRPNPRVYADYYTLIRNPIALEDIKKKIKSGQYTDLESVRKDLELCFNNAKDYNLPESIIYTDAKDLLKLANKTYRKLMPSEHGENSKPPSMKRLLNSRIQKVMKKTDDNGRILSTMFLELPNKKLWPVYYKQIHEPRCLEAIQKQVKRKEYKSAAEFAADVELVFSNAMTFNMEHTQIWEDALTLRDFFRQLMADLPPPHALPQYTHPPPHKIKIRMSAAQPSAPEPPIVEEPASSSTPHPPLALRVPAPTKPAISKPPEMEAQISKPPLPAAPVTAPSLSVPIAPTQVPAAPNIHLPEPEPVPEGKLSIPRSDANQLPVARLTPKPPTAQSVVAQPIPQPSIAQPTPKPSIAQPAAKPPIVPPTTKPPIAQPAPKPFAAHLTAKPHPAIKATKSSSRTPQSRTPQPILQLHPTMSVYGNTTVTKAKYPSYMQPTPPPIPPAAAITPSYIASIVPKVSTPTPVLATPPPPSPVIPSSHQIRHIMIRTEPRGRLLKLDHRDGVTSWAMPLERDEKSLSVGEIVFMAELGDSSGEEDEGDDDAAEMDVDSAPEPLKKRRGRPPKVVKTAAVISKPKVPVSPKKKKPKKRGEMLIKLNGTIVKEDEERSGNWDVELSVGSNVVEVGEQGGLIWKVYAQRIS
ncbi:Bromodomain-containing protein [Lentinula edodes]|uniref:Bromodomain-containing protein n=1 Tax=Lentinula lateritia TaxID=40482 RepID=A0A9W9APD2_9AGAR|nr:Bromodomain-containing protein [Lentinula edodes]